MTAGRLGRRYRRALWAYPPGPRRAELLDTLLDAAPEGRRWPTARERANLLGHGLRARLGRPGSRGVVALAVLVSLFAGFLAASAAHAIALTASADLPRGAALAEKGADGVVRFLTREPVVVAAVIMSPLIVSGLTGLGSEILRRGVPREPFWALTLTWAYPYTGAAIACYALALAVTAAWPRPGRRSAQPGPAG